MTQILHNLVFDYTLRTVALGSAILGIVSGSLGVFAVLRRQSLLGDSVSHTALPGIALAFLLTGSKAPLMLIIGAAVAGWVGTLFVLHIISNTPIKADGALGMILSVFFGFGLVLLTLIQKMPNSRQAGLEKFLFGQASALMVQDVVIMAILGGLSLVLLAVLWKEFKLLSFDPEYAVSLGFPTRTITIILTTILVIAVVIGLQTVGVVLMSAMIVAPASAARQWTDRLGGMVLLSGLFGVMAGVSGAVISSLTAKLPTGPTIVLCISVIVIVSILFAPNRGLVMRAGRNYRNRQRLITDAILLDLYELGVQHHDPYHAHPSSTLKVMSVKRGNILQTLRHLREQQLVAESGDDNWSLTVSGVEKARALADRAEEKA
ncbi:MAG: metal ABC transporter permease [candidate division Zixibacteria bacterium]|nr:metal ABC transporter permease [candidate division Zixibacteria bacterium]